MLILKRLAVLILSFTVVLSTAYASNEEWRVVEMQGIVRLAHNAPTNTLVSTGDTLGAGSVLSTGLDGRAILVRGKQQIVVGPNSRMSLPMHEEKGMTRILQDLGTMMFKVDKRGKQHFTVETPVIAAVVKGTTFTVSANSAIHTVHVAEGLVEVTPHNNHDSVLVAAGETVNVSAEDASFINLNDENLLPKNNDKRSNDEGRPESRKHSDLLIIPADIGAEPLDFAMLTKGLVRDGGGVAANGSHSGLTMNKAANEDDASAASPTSVAGEITTVASIVTISADAGDTGVDLGLGADASGATVGLDLNAGDAGVTASLGLDAAVNAVDTGVDLGLDVGAGVGDAGVDLGLDVGADVSDAGVDLGLDVGADAGDAGVDLGLDVGAGAGDAGVDLGLDVGADAGDTGLDLGLDLGDSGVDLGIGKEGVDLDLGLSGLGL